ncbi:MAG TPA: hydroxymethylglutaryl-CoA lyase, partial [Brevundimonas sp.]|nr:hydroxymethylglutaryl-CoA lyase [Brevundimonas sp.]
LHFHNTRNTALANIYAAVEAGVDVIDASCGGIGGCPFAPKATGNVATEDVVYMLHRAGFDTGIDLDGMIDT